MNRQVHRFVFDQLQDYQASASVHGLCSWKGSKRKTTTAGVWQAQSGQGQTSQTANQTQINGQLVIGQGINTTVQIPEGALKTQIEALSQQPGQEYLAELASNPKVNWDQIKLAHDQWQYSQQGLTGAGAALLAIAVAYFTAGMGSSLVGTTTTTAATASTAAVTTTTLGSTVLTSATAATATAGASMVTYAAGAAINAGFSALASSAAVSFVNNGGDLSKTLKDLGSKDSVKNILISMATAGALNELGNAKLIGDKALSQITAADGFTANLGKSLINNMASATMNSALTGAKLEDSLKTALMSAVISAGAGQAAFAIGGLTVPGTDGKPPVLNAAGQALAHALAGCVAGAAGSGSQGCQSGAIGAVVGELAAQWYDPTGLKPKDDTLAFVKVVSAVAGAITGDGSAQSVNTAVMTGVNAAENNYLNHTQWKQLTEKLKTCTPGADCDAVVKEYTALSAKQDAALAAACQDLSSAACRARIGEAVQGTQTQQELAAAGKLPANYLAGADYNANANLYAKKAFLSDLKTECANNPSCDAKKTAALTKLGSAALDFVPVIGDIKAYVEAETPFDYLLATVGMAGPVGDSVAKALREGKALYKAGDIAAASGKLDEAKNIVTHEAYKDTLRASMSKPVVSDPKLADLIDSLYRPNAAIGSGSTAAAVRQELATGQPVGGAFHTQKAEDAIRSLERWLAQNPTAQPGDRAAAENLIKDMQNALEGK